MSEPVSESVPEPVSELSEQQDPAPQDISEPSTDAPADEPASVGPDTPPAADPPPAAPLVAPAPIAPAPAPAPAAAPAPVSEPPPVPSVFAPIPGFRGQQRFSNPSEPGVSTPLPAEWTAPTPPHGVPVITAPPVPGSFDGAPAGVFAGPAGRPGLHGQPVPGHPLAPGHPVAPVRPAAGPIERPAAGDFATPYRDLSTDALLGQRKNPPTAGWRKALYVASFKQINVGESHKATHLNNLIGEVSQPLQGCYRIALMSLKGGVGKTTITANLATVFARLGITRATAARRSSTASCTGFSRRNSAVIVTWPSEIEVYRCFKPCTDETLFSILRATSVSSWAGTAPGNTAMMLTIGSSMSGMSCTFIAR